MVGLLIRPGPQDLQTLSQQKINPDSQTQNTLKLLFEIHIGETVLFLSGVNSRTVLMLRNIQSFWWKLTQLFVTFKIFFYNESREVLYQIVKDQHSGDLTLFI